MMLREQLMSCLAEKETTRLFGRDTMVVVIEQRAL